MGDKTPVDDQTLINDVDDETKEVKDEDPIIKFSTYNNMMKRLKTVEKENRLHLEAKAEEEQRRMDEKGQYKELNEKLADDLKLANDKNESILKKIDNSVKLSEFERSLPSKLSNRDFLQFVKVDQIEMDDDHKVNQLSLKMEVDRFVSQYPNLLESNDDEIPANQSKNGSIKGLSHSEWVKFPLKEQKARYKEMYENEEKNKK